MGIAHDKVINGVRVLAAYGTDNAGFRHFGGNIARQERALVLGIGDIQHIVYRCGGGIVNPDEVYFGILYRNCFHVKKFPAHQNNNLGSVCRVANLLGMVCVVAFNGPHLHTKVLCQAVGTFLRGIVKRTVAKRAGNHNGHCHFAIAAAGLAGLVVICCAAGKNA